MGGAKGSVPDDVNKQKKRDSTVASHGALAASKSGVQEQAERRREKAGDGNGNGRARGESNLRPHGP